MSKLARAGAISLIAAPVIGFVATLMLPTMSDGGSDVVAALGAHHGAMIAGLTLSTLSIAPMVAGVVWLAATLRPHAKGLALTGGVFAVAGALVVLFEDGITAALPSVASSLDSAQAATTIDHLHSSAAAALDPLALLLDVGLAMLGFAAVRAGAPRWVASALTVAVLAQGIGFGAASRPLVVVGFAAMAVLLTMVVVRLSTPAPQRARAQQAAAAG